MRAFDASGKRSPDSPSISVKNGSVVGGSGGGGSSGGACQPTRSSEKGPSCRDGLDNDCDGVIDALDPDC